MSSQPQFRHFLLLNLAMLCVGTSGSMGRLITLAPPQTIWWRALIGLLFLGAYCWYRGFDLRLGNRTNPGLIWLSGLLMATHWVTYFYALAWSSVAIGMLSIYTYPAITTLLEPLLLRKPFERVHLMLAGLVLLGIYFLAPSFDLSNDKTAGLAMGILSALVYSLRNILLKTQVAKVEGSVIMLYQLIFTVAILLPVLYLYPGIPAGRDWLVLLVLGLITTAIGHTLFLSTFKHFSVSTASLLGSIQPIYGIFLGFLFLGEIPGIRSVIGGALILSSILIEGRRTLSTKQPAQ